MSKYEKTKYPNIFCYETKKGKKFRIRRAFYKDGKKTELDESGFRTLAEAKVRLAEIERVLAMNESDYLTQKNLTCDEYYQKYSLRKLQVKQWSKATKIKHDADWRNHISPVFGNIPMSKLKLETYTLWIAEKLKKYRKSSVISYHHTFMNMLNDAVSMGVIERNRLRRVVIGDSDLEPKSRRFSFEDYQIWMAAAEKYLTPYDFTFVYLCSFGLRRGEILGLKPSSILYKKGFNAKLDINDSRTSSEPNGKGTTKTGVSRWIALNQKGTELLQIALNEAKEIKKDFGEILHQDDYLYINPITGKPYDVGQLNRLFSRINEITELHAFPHLLRHYFTTQALIAGAPKEHVANYLGHATTYMTDRYEHIQDEVADNVINIVDKRLKFGES